MVDQRRQIIDEIHKLNILLIHTKLKTTRARTVARATTHVETSTRQDGNGSTAQAVQTHRSRR